MNKRILDSSVLVAIFKEESYETGTLNIVEGAIMGAVNYAEVWTKIHTLSIAISAHIDAVFALLQDVEPFTEVQARLTGLLEKRTRHAGLSLGDRACLALALELDAEVYTADRQWAKIDVGLKIHLIR